MPSRRRNKQSDIPQVSCLSLRLLSLLAVALSVVSRICSQNIVRQSCGIQAQFYKIANNHAMKSVHAISTQATSSVAGCLDMCVAEQTCKAFNFQRSTLSCQLLKVDRNTHATDIEEKSGWDYYDSGLYSSNVGSLCKSFTYNPCYPCRCSDNCHNSSGYSCECRDGSPQLPKFYIAFESTLPDDTSKVPYDRGEDSNGNKRMVLGNNALIGASEIRSGKVLKLKGVDAGAVIGDVSTFNLKKPYKGKGQFTVAFWVKVASTSSDMQRLLGCGAYGQYTGLYVKYRPNTKQFLTKYITESGMIDISLDGKIKDSLLTWSHITVQYNKEITMQLKVYVNAQKIGEAAYHAHSTAKGTYDHPNLIVGAGTLEGLNNDHQDIEIDDLAYWEEILTEEEIAFVMNKGYNMDKV